MAGKPEPTKADKEVYGGFALLGLFVTLSWWGYGVIDWLFVIQGRVYELFKWVQWQLKPHTHDSGTCELATFVLVVAAIFLGGLFFGVGIYNFCRMIDSACFQATRHAAEKAQSEAGIANWHAARAKLERHRDLARNLFSCDEDRERAIDEATDRHVYGDS